ncbi:hypothetical protein PCANC_12324 [Puccinia coronata f. sp. avenae]|uniref:Uncharacterized protein n=1 Tax=Puccinia coronata f. sp. avenae TaxID=200324 RepID=A0A2N5V3R1_9BASI|nr:hypothetical protein PCANC_12324 [Puccinia coronata f. sp. avenae]
MNLADFLTKPTGRCTIRRSLAAIGVTSPHEENAHCLPTQSTPGCQILSTDQNGNKMAAKRNRRVTTKDHEDNENTGRCDAAEKFQQKEKSHETNP